MSEALPKERGGDIEAITILWDHTEQDRGNASDALTSAAIKRLENRLASLDWLCRISRMVRPALVAELKKLRKPQPERKSSPVASQSSQKKRVSPRQR